MFCLENGYCDNESRSADGKLKQIGKVSSLAGQNQSAAFTSRLFRLKPVLITPAT
jgi:hypothetical protein